MTHEEILHELSRIAGGDNLNSPDVLGSTLRWLATEADLLATRIDTTK